jgi:hypothetical protein
MRFGDPVTHPAYGNCMVIGLIAGPPDLVQIAGRLPTDAGPGTGRQVNPIVPVASLTPGGKSGLSVSGNVH